MVELYLVAETRVIVVCGQLVVVDLRRAVMCKRCRDEQSMVPSLRESQTVSHLNWYLIVGCQVDLSVNNEH